MVTRGPSQVRVSGPLAPHVDGFRATLDARRFSPSSQLCYLNSLSDGDDGILAGLTVDAVRSFVIAESGRRGTGSLKNQVTAVRSLLRFLHLRGRIPDPVDGAAPAAAGWHRPPLTRHIRPGDVAAILASCDRDTHAGRRDYAILMLLSRLGLRAGEAAAARVGD